MCGTAMHIASTARIAISFMLWANHCPASQAAESRQPPFVLATEGTDEVLSPTGPVEVIQVVQPPLEPAQFSSKGSEQAPSMSSASGVSLEHIKELARNVAAAESLDVDPSVIDGVAEAVAAGLEGPAQNIPNVLVNTESSPQNHEGTSLVKSSDIAQSIAAAAAGSPTARRTMRREMPAVAADVNDDDMQFPTQDESLNMKQVLQDGADAAGYQVTKQVTQCDGDECLTEIVSQRPIGGVNSMAQSNPQAPSSNDVTFVDEDILVPRGSLAFNMEPVSLAETFSEEHRGQGNSLRRTQFQDDRLDGAIEGSTYQVVNRTTRCQGDECVTKVISRRPATGNSSQIELDGTPEALRRAQGQADGKDVLSLAQTQGDKANDNLRRAESHADSEGDALRRVQIQGDRQDGIAASSYQVVRRFTRCHGNECITKLISKRPKASSSSDMKAGASADSLSLAQGQADGENDSLSLAQGKADAETDALHRAQVHADSRDATLKGDAEIDALHRAQAQGDRLDGVVAKSYQVVKRVTRCHGGECVTQLTSRRPKTDLASALQTDGTLDSLSRAQGQADAEDHLSLTQVRGDMANDSLNAAQEQADSNADTLSFSQAKGDAEVSKAQARGNRLDGQVDSDYTVVKRTTHCHGDECTTTITSRRPKTTLASEIQTDGTLDSLSSAQIKADTVDSLSLAQLQGDVRSDSLQHDEQQADGEAETLSQAQMAGDAESDAMRRSQLQGDRLDGAVGQRYQVIKRVTRCHGDECTTEVTSKRAKSSPASELQIDGTLDTQSRAQGQAGSEDPLSFAQVQGDMGLDSLHSAQEYADGEEDAVSDAQLAGDADDVLGRTQLQSDRHDGILGENYQVVKRDTRCHGDECITKLISRRPTTVLASEFKTDGTLDALSRAQGQADAAESLSFAQAQGDMGLDSLHSAQEHADGEEDALSDAQVAGDADGALGRAQLQSDRLDGTLGANYQVVKRDMRCHGDECITTVTSRRPKTSLASELQTDGTLDALGRAQGQADAEDPLSFAQAQGDLVLDSFHSAQEHADGEGDALSEAQSAGDADGVLDRAQLQSDRLDGTLGANYEVVKRDTRCHGDECITKLISRKSKTSLASELKTDGTLDALSRAQGQADAEDPLSFAQEQGDMGLDSLHSAQEHADGEEDSLDRAQLQADAAEGTSLAQLSDNSLQLAQQQADGEDPLSDDQAKGKAVDELSFAQAQGDIAIDSLGRSQAQADTEVEALYSAQAQGGAQNQGDRVDGGAGKDFTVVKRSTHCQGDECITELISRRPQNSLTSEIATRSIPEQHSAMVGEGGKIKNRQLRKKLITRRMTANSGSRNLKHQPISHDHDIEDAIKRMFQKLHHQSHRGSAKKEQVHKNDGQRHVMQISGRDRDIRQATETSVRERHTTSQGLQAAKGNCKNTTKKGEGCTVPLSGNEVAITGSIFIGSQARPLQCIFDTGSKDLIIKSVEYDPHQQKIITPYSHKHSTTYQSFHEQAAVGYGSGDAAVRVGADDVKIGNTVVPQVMIGEIVAEKGLQILHYEELGMKFPNIQCILGLMHMRKPLPHVQSEHSVFDRMRANGVDNFGYCSKAPGSAELTLNDQSGDGVEVPVVSDFHWAAELSEVGVGPKDGTKISMCNGKARCSAIMDTGTSIITGPHNAIAELVDAIGVAEDCSNLHKLPDLTFKLGGHQLRLKPSAYVVQVEQPVAAESGRIFGREMAQETEEEPDHKANIRDTYIRRCMPAFRPADARLEGGGPLHGSPMWIFGEPFFAQYYTRFSWPNKKADSASAVESPKTGLRRDGLAEAKASSDSWPFGNIFGGDNSTTDGPRLYFVDASEKCPAAKGEEKKPGIEASASSFVVAGKEGASSWTPRIFRVPEEIRTGKRWESGSNGMDMQSMNGLGLMNTGI